MHSSQIQVNDHCGDRYAFDVTTSDNSAMRAVDLLALDKKMDDAVADDGNVLSGQIRPTSCSDGGVPFNGALSGCSTGTTYTTNGTYECTPLIRIGGQVGNPQ
jgi:hypothetical protein